MGSSETAKRILLIDLDDLRRETRVRMLRQEGYSVILRTSHVDAEKLEGEGRFDLVILTLHHAALDDAAAYSERLRKQKPDLPILLLTDNGVFVPRGTLSPSVETGYPLEFMQEVASMLAGSKRLREIEIER